MAVTINIYYTGKENGDAAARIMAYPNGVRMKFDWVCAKYLYRMIYSQPTGPNSATISMRTEHARSIDILQHFLLMIRQAAQGIPAQKLHQQPGDPFLHLQGIPLLLQIGLIGIRLIIITFFFQKSYRFCEIFSPIFRKVGLLLSVGKPVR